MLPARIAELLTPFLGAQALSPAQLQSISTYIDILLRWNARINLTAIRDPEEIVIRHFGESLFAATHLFPESAVGWPATERQESEAHGVSRGSAECATSGPAAERQKSEAHGVSRGSVECATGGPAAERPKNAAHGASRGSTEQTSLAPEGRKNPPSVADLGSGAGFPGLPIKLWAPQIRLTLIESNHKKATFLKEITRALTLTDVNIQTTRAEALVQTKLAQTKDDAKFDVVTLRAVESFASILPIAASLLALSGRLALLIGSPQLAQAQAALPHLAWSNPAPIPLSHSRILAVGTSVQSASSAP